MASLSVTALSTVANESDEQRKIFDYKWIITKQFLCGTCAFGECIAVELGLRALGCETHTCHLETRGCVSWGNVAINPEYKWNQFVTYSLELRVVFFSHFACFHFKKKHINQQYLFVRLVRIYFNWKSRLTIACVCVYWISCQLARYLLERLCPICL